MSLAMLSCTSSSSYSGYGYDDRACSTGATDISSYISTITDCTREKYTDDNGDWYYTHPFSLQCVTSTTKSPTRLPTAAPTTKAPTIAPSTTKTPTIPPSAASTTRTPTVAPSVPSATSKNPTVKPSTHAPSAPSAASKTPTIKPTTAKPNTIAPTTKAGSPSIKPTRQPTMRPSAKPTTAPGVESLTVTVSINQLLEDVSVNQFNANFNVNSKVFAKSVVNASYDSLLYSWIQVSNAATPNSKLTPNTLSDLSIGKNGQIRKLIKTKSASKKRHYLNAEIEALHAAAIPAAARLASKQAATAGGVSPAVPLTPAAANLLRINPMAVTKSYAMIPWKIVIYVETSSTDDYSDDDMYDDDGNPSADDLKVAMEEFLTATQELLDQVIADGSFTDILQTNAVSMGSKALTNVTVGEYYVASSTYVLSTGASKAKKTLAAGGIAGIVIGLIVFIGLIFAVYYFFFRNNKAVMPQQNAGTMKVAPTPVQVVPGGR